MDRPLMLLLMAGSERGKPSVPLIHAINQALYVGKPRRERILKQKSMCTSAANQVKGRDWEGGRRESWPPAMGALTRTEQLGERTHPLHERAILDMSPGEGSQVASDVKNFGLTFWRAV